MFLKIYKTSQKDQLAYASYSLAHRPAINLDAFCVFDDILKHALAESENNVTR
jgi:hypothetical protein